MRSLIGDQFHIEPPGDLHQVGQAGHTAVIVHNLADHAGGFQAGQPGQIDGGFGVTGPSQYAALDPRSAGKYDPDDGNRRRGSRVR